MSRLSILLLAVAGIQAQVYDQNGNLAQQSSHGGYYEGSPTDPLVIPQGEPQEGPVKALFGCFWDFYRKPKSTDVHFYLYTRKNKNTPKELFIPKHLILSAPQHGGANTPMLTPVEVGDVGESEDHVFQPSYSAPSKDSLAPFNILDETKVLIHGFLQSSKVAMFQDMKDAFLAKGDYNVIVMDWETFSSNCYSKNLVIKTLKELGRLLASLLDGLAQKGVSLKNIHLVGFSLGAHLAGHAGAHLMSGKVGRITGLDPAAPLIKLIPDLSLDALDADLVDVIHTSTDFGQPEPMGHVDFYPNAGKSQPGCFIIEVECSHGRSVAYFTESINSSGGFWATSCPSWEIFQKGLCIGNPKALMGEPFHSGATGKYFLVTRGGSPYAKSN